jgi:hypothetical protein
MKMEITDLEKLKITDELRTVMARYVRGSLHQA